MGGRQFSIDICSGQIFQVAIVVEDIEASMRFYAQHLKIGPFTIMKDFVAPAGNYRGSTDIPAISIAHVYTGRMFLELIEQHTETPSVYFEHTEKYGFGLHHYGIAIAPEDYDRVMDEYYAKGFEDVFSDMLPSGARIRYIAPKDPSAMTAMKADSGVSYLECVDFKPEEESFFAGMREAASKWDGKTISVPRTPTPYV